MSSLTACRPDRGEINPRGYFGPTESLSEVLLAINANNEPIRTLWANHYFEATIVDPEGRSRFVNGDGVVLYRKPRDLLLRGNKDIAGKVFEIGSNDERFWFTVIPETDTMWWGHYRNIGKPCASEIPIRPDLVLEVLGVADIDLDLLRQPVPTMRFNNDADAYMLTWNVQLPDRWIAQREVWYDRQTKLPRVVLLFDANGRVILRAYLSDHQPVGNQAGPRIATQYRLFFPDSKTNMSLTLSNVAFERRGAPNDRAFMFPQQPGVSREIQIDQQCND